MSITLAVMLAVSTTSLGIQITILPSPQEEMKVCLTKNTNAVCECSVPLVSTYIEKYGENDLKTIRKQAQMYCEQKIKGIDSPIIVY